MAVSDGARFESPATAGGLPQPSQLHAGLLAHLTEPGALVGKGHAKGSPER
jgi:hypothetical protein